MQTAIEVTPWTFAQAAVALGSSGMVVFNKFNVQWDVKTIHPSSIAISIDGKRVGSATFESLAENCTLPCGSPCGIVNTPRTLPTETTPEYRLTLSRRQAAVIREALESYSRLLCGQVDMVMSDAFMCRKIDRDRLRQLSNELKSLVFPDLHPNASYGVGNRVYPESTVAWDIQQVIRHRLAWDRLADEGKSKPTHWGVCFDEAMAFSGEPLATIERVG